MNSGTHSNPSGLILSTVASVVSWLPALDLWLRIGASVVAIVSGVVYIVVHVKAPKQ